MRNQPGIPGDERGFGRNSDSLARLHVKLSAMNTASNLPIENLSLAEKLLLMERLWEDLSRRPTDVPVPDWHGDILSQRQAAVREGRTSLVD